MEGFPFLAAFKNTLSRYLYVPRLGTMYFEVAQAPDYTRFGRYVSSTDRYLQSDHHLQPPLHVGTSAAAVHGYQLGFLSQSSMLGHLTYIVRTSKLGRNEPWKERVPLHFIFPSSTLLHHTTFTQLPHNFHATSTQTYSLTLTYTHHTSST